MEVGPSLPNWSSREAPTVDKLVGRYCNLIGFNSLNNVDQVVDELFAGLSSDPDGFTYMFDSPFESKEDFKKWFLGMKTLLDPFYLVVMVDGHACGMVSFMRIERNMGVIEIGRLHFCPSLMRTCAGTETIYLLIKHAFDLGYRRVEWKCDALNKRSRNAALRYGFVFEGIFRNAMIYKQRSRDTAWFSIIDSEWASKNRAFEQWLDPQNFNSDGSQIHSLRELQNPR